MQPARGRQDIASWRTIGDISVGIRQRPELGEQNANRIANMRLCADGIDGMTLAPGAVFCMRRAIGEPTVARGFRSGPSLVNGALEQDTGGGICQVSTVLFNMALLSGLEILEKHNHSTDIWGEKRLIDLGRDAAFAYAIKDLKFRNWFDAPVALRLQVTDDESALVGTVTSPVSLPGEVEVTTSVLEELLPPGDAPANCRAVSGWRVHTIRQMRIGDHAETTFDHTDHYRPTYTRDEAHGHAR